MSQNNRYMAVSVTEPKADTKRPKIGGQSHGTGVQDANVTALERDFGIYKRENEIQMEELRAKVNNMPKGGGAGEPGKDGVGIESVEQTVTSTESGGENKVEITLTDGQKTEVVIRNGKDGKDGGGGGGGGNVTPESIGAVKKSGDTMTGQLSLPSLRVTNYGTPLEMGKYLDMHNPNSPDDDFSVRLIADGDTLKMHRKGTGYYDTFYHTGNKPTAADIGAAERNSTHLSETADLNTITDEGEYYYGWWQETIQNSPVHSAFHLSVERISADEVSQTYTVYTVGNNEVWFRQSNNGKTSWSAWKKIATTDQIPTTADAVGALKRGTYERIQGTAAAHKNLNDYTLPGFYNVKTAYVDNCPSGIGVDAVLLVYPWDNNIYNMQEITETAASPMCRRWTRHSNAGTWTAWKSVITEDSKSLITAADLGAFGQLGNYSNLISDLNEFKSIGAIYITSAKANQPTNTSPYASVWNIAGIGSTYMIQNFLDVVGMRQYYRGFIDGTWTAWKQIATTDYIDEQILKGEW